MLIVAHLIVDGHTKTVRQCWLGKETFSERKTFLKEVLKILEWECWSRSCFELRDLILDGDVKALQMLLVLNGFWS